MIISIALFRYNRSSFTNWIQHIMKYCFQEHLQLTLTIITIVISVGFLIWYYQRTRRFTENCKNAITVEKAWKKFYFILLGIAILSFALISSYYIFFSPIKSPQNAWQLVNPSIMFLLIILIQILIASWIIALLAGLFNPDRIAEFGAKFFGFEISHKYAPGQIDYIANGLENLEMQIKIIANLNKATLDYIAGPFENTILNSISQANKIRQVVRDILIKNYEPLPLVKIYVIPLTEIEFQNLPERIASTVRLLNDEGIDVSQIEFDTVGISIHHGSEDLGTAIIIDGTEQEYEVTLAELFSAGNFFVSISTIIDWANKSS